jgi:FkbM family methyltransferase
MVPRAPLERDLIFDIGLFTGQDTRFYLDKGFRVVALEAQPALIAAAQQRFAQEIGAGRLVIVGRALWHHADETIDFFIRDGWSSVFRDAAERDGGSSTRITAQTTTLCGLFGQHSVPYYIKCDIEGGDAILVEQLARDHRRPAFVSVEDPTGDCARVLVEAGYDRFQMVNQGYLNLARLPRPPREGSYVPRRFDGTTSGAFGRELRARDWVDFPELMRRLATWHALRERAVNPIREYACRRWGKLTGRGWLIKGGWSDIHATRADTLAALG